MIKQRLNNDCGVAALATLLSVSYETVATAWLEVTGRGPGPSSYKTLRDVAAHLGYSLVQVRECTAGIRRVRWEAGSSHSHWVVLSGPSLWCPWVGESTVAQYPAKYWGHGLVLVL